MCNATNLSHIIAIHKNKVIAKRIKMRDKGRSKVVRRVDVKEKERNEEVEDVEDRETPP